MFPLPIFKKYPFFKKRIPTAIIQQTLIFENETNINNSQVSIILKVHRWFQHD